ncbi:biotin carboxylase N-terminal domain-containing protein [Microbacterium sp. RU33B]|uniref:acetyl/propionyl/methylcrotonyl-CoA carboxylase subunit alpha n=1 Tax=Microbacterium sp. RU33B TaxID=1907390 RepID=UPI00095F535C|nr:biotin carboxylase N-terminal domain-containing protein [Microbacterium sp. RU33B]SIT75990.1 acetyl-CoA/propionyl-CoA carboxylase, biotin carboxylase, biotin carboxyl carrier protein [Microbacterium sp. RU33B]
MFDTVLVANRGEIARRVIRTLRRLGIRSVAVYSDADASAPHVREADVAVRIGPAAAAQSYLSIDAVLAAAVATGAQAIHPGYGFLSENSAFARACAAAGIVFLGPGERALEVMGDKIRSKEHVVAHGVPVVPGFSAAGMTDADIASAAEAAGFPLLVKPSAGGGGKGMQIVRTAAELPEALATARRVAAAAFGDDTLLLERLIERPRHIEVQVLADAHGTVIHLGERECTLQRRHQKVIEEAPSPIVDDRARARLGAAACAAAASVDYRGAGTVEFLVAGDRPDEFFFIEMNTRLQVEHPVTELVTGIDLVEQQLRVGAGLSLDLAQDDVRWDGHAIEARVYAESPERGFLPSTGDVRIWRAARDVRTDSAVEDGSVVSADYDPMIAKVIAWADDRRAALAKLDAALAETVVLGVDTNIGFLRALVADPAVQDGDLDTGLIDRLPAFVGPEPSASALQAAASAVLGAGELPDAGPWAPKRPVPGGSPVARRALGAWHGLPGWRIGTTSPLRVRLDDGSEAHTVTVDAGAPLPSSAKAPSRIEPAAAARDLDADAGSGEPNGTGETIVAVGDDGEVWVHADGAAHRLRVIGRREAMERRLAARGRVDGAADPELRAPMPGAVVAVHVADGSRVAGGDRIATIEAMKMEHPVTAPHNGVVRVDVAVGEQVRRDQVLAHVTPDPSTGSGTATGPDAQTSESGRTD